MASAMVAKKMYGTAVLGYIFRFNRKAIEILVTFF